MKLKIAGNIGMLFVGLLLGGALDAKDFSAYRPGDVADRDLIAPVSFDVVDAAATAALKSSRTAQIPPVFRNDSGANQDLSLKIETAFNAARSNFLNAVQSSFHRKILDPNALASADFGYFVTAFNIENKTFPVPMTLAVAWAGGKNGNDEKNQWLNRLLPLTQKFIRPDKVPDEFAQAKIARLVAAKLPDEKLTLTDLETRGQTVSQSDLLPLSQVRALFRRQFAVADEQPLARILAGWLKPNCAPDAPLTQLSRERAVQQLIVAEHYAAGQIIAPRGAVIDAKTKAALDALAARANSNSGQQETVAVISPIPLNLPSPKISKTTASVEPQNEIIAIQKTSLWKIELALIIGTALAGIMILAASAKMISFRKPKILAVAIANKNQPPIPLALQTALAPELARAVRETLAQELAGQRRDLLFAQQRAAAEVARLVRKMDRLQMAMRERLETYETHIEKLETELAARTVENRDLIQLKIEMIREQSRLENAGQRSDFNGF